MEETKDKPIREMDFELNIKKEEDKTNLPVEQEQTIKYPSLPVEKTDAERKEEQIRKWNETQEVKNSGIRAIDTDKEVPIDKKRYSWIKTTSIIGIIALILIALGVGVFAYLAWEDGTLLNPINVINNVTCGDQTIPKCPDIPACPNVQCGDCNFPKKLDVTILNESD